MWDTSQCVAARAGWTVMLADTRGDAVPAAANPPSVPGTGPAQRPGTAATIAHAASSLPGIPPQPLSNAARQQWLRVRQTGAASGGHTAWRRHLNSQSVMVWAQEGAEERRAGVERSDGEGASGPLTQRHVRAFRSSGGLDWVRMSQARSLEVGFDLASVAALPFGAKLEWFRSQVRAQVVRGPCAKWMWACW